MRLIENGGNTATGKRNAPEIDRYSLPLGPDGTEIISSGRPLWIPEPPFVDERLRYAYGRPFKNADIPSIYFHVPFLGENAAKLHNLRRMTALIDPGVGFQGFVFAYDDGREDLFGRRSIMEADRAALYLPFQRRYVLEQTFSISGGEGEYIVGARVSSRRTERFPKWIPQVIEVCWFRKYSTHLPS